jgi:hypothetical protein
MKAMVRTIFLLSLFASPAAAQQTIGYVRELTGSAQVLRGSDAKLAEVGLPLQKGDLIRTNKPGAVGIVLIDDTTVSLGSNSELSLKDYDFSPKEGKFSLVMRMVKGTFVYVSGQISKLAPEAVQLSIPDATIAIRGTRLLIEVEE